tara:strand:+ start:311 stop:484 length:174 start_codon:yes stop_codon:yes gene_type:complete
LTSADYALRRVIPGEKKGELISPFGVMAERTGLEPATTGVTGRYSNQLNYRSEKDGG